MKKRVIAFLLGMSMTAALVGCGSQEISNDTITIKQYKGLEVEKVEVVKVTDEAVEQSIQSTLEAHATTSELTENRPAQIGDMVLIAYEGKLAEDGSTFDSSDEYQVELDKEGMGNIDGFEAQIIGHSIGEEFEIKTTFPEDYHATDVAGKDAIFTVTLNSIQEVHVPELTDELIPQITDKVKTVKEFRKMVREDLELSNKQDAEDRLQSLVLEALLENCVVETYPEDRIEELTSSMESFYYYNTGMDANTYLSYYGTTLEAEVQKVVKQELALALIAEEEEITLSNKEYKKGLAEYAEADGYTVKEYKEMIDEDALRDALLQNKVVEFLVENSVQVEAKATEE